MALTKKAKVLTKAQETAVLGVIAQHGRYRERNLAMFLLSAKAGLRAAEIALLDWSMITDAARQLADDINLPNRATKGDYGGRVIPMHAALRAALAALYEIEGGTPEPAAPVIRSERGRKAATGGRLTAKAVSRWFGDLYRIVGFEGCTSHSGRRTFVTRAARQAIRVGASLRDVQYLAGHADLRSTQEYIDTDEHPTHRRLVDLL